MPYLPEKCFDSAQKTAMITCATSLPDSPHPILLLVKIQGLPDSEGLRRPPQPLGRVFHIRGPATVKALLPTVVSLPDGTSRQLELAERSDRRLAESPNSPPKRSQVAYRGDWWIIVTHPHKMMPHRSPDLLSIYADSDPWPTSYQFQLAGCENMKQWRARWTVGRSTANVDDCFPIQWNQTKPKQIY